MSQFYLENRIKKKSVKLCTICSTENVSKFDSSVCSDYLSSIIYFQNLISAATGVNLTTVDDPIQRKFLPSFLRGIAEENKLVTSPNFVVTQALVALLADKGAKLRPNYDKTEIEKKGMIKLCFRILIIRSSVPHLFIRKRLARIAYKWIHF